MAQLPQEFLTRMQEMLGDEFDAFLTSYDAPRTAGLRVNTKKCRTEDFPPLVPGTWKKIPWIPNGYFVPDGMRMGQSPLYAAGVFYLQEPSAMTPASRLPIEPGERVLDLCAAPGGKATELNARLKGTGLLVANDISNARAKALLRNLSCSEAKTCLSPMRHRQALQTSSRASSIKSSWMHRAPARACSGKTRQSSAPGPRSGRISLRICSARSPRMLSKCCVRAAS